MKQSDIKHEILPTAGTPVQPVLIVKLEAEHVVNEGRRSMILCSVTLHQVFVDIRYHTYMCVYMLLNFLQDLTNLQLYKHIYKQIYNKILYPTTTNRIFWGCHFLKLNCFINLSFPPSFTSFFNVFFLIEVQLTYNIM